MYHDDLKKPNNFTPVVKACELADYVYQITNNPKTFPDYTLQKEETEDGRVVMVYAVRPDSLTNWVRDQARRIFVLLYTANKIDLDKEPWRKQERLSKQAEAIRLCEEHDAAIELCKKHFRFSKRRRLAWGRVVREVKIATIGWHKSDKARYKDVPDL